MAWSSNDLKLPPCAPPNCPPKKAAERYLDRCYEQEHKWKFARIVYKFALPLKTKVHEEYLITDGFTLFGSLGGTLGLFIGFSISNVVSYIMDFFKNKPLLKKMKHRSEVS